MKCISYSVTSRSEIKGSNCTRVARKAVGVFYQVAGPVIKALLRAVVDSTLSSWVGQTPVSAPTSKLGGVASRPRVS